MTNKHVTQQLQEEIKKQHTHLKKIKIPQRLLVAGISAIAILGFIGQQNQNLSEKEAILGSASSAALICWSLMRASNMRLNAENHLIYDSLNKFEGTKLNFNQKLQITKNLGVAGITFAGAMFSSFIPIISAGIGKMNSSVATTASTLILISSEVFLKYMFKKNNQILRQALPQGVKIPHQKQREQ